VAAGIFISQFADTIIREVVAQLLGVQERADWRACALPEDEDKEDAAAFKAAFAPFDPSA
jgi:hypothetical protein